LIIEHTLHINGYSGGRERRLTNQYLSWSMTWLHRPVSGVHRSWQDSWMLWSQFSRTFGDKVTFCEGGLQRSQ